MQKPVLVGVVGGSGSGKTWLARAIIERFGPQHSVLIEQDWYYRDLGHLEPEEAAKTDFDQPDAIEFELLERQLKALTKGKAVQAPQYAFANFSRKKETVTLQPAPIIVVEGLFVLQHAPLAKQLDLSVFVETDDDVRLLRRIRRDMAERGYELDRILDFWERYQIPSFRRHVKPQRRSATHLWNSLQDSAFVPAFLADLQKRIARHATQPTA